MINLGRSPNPEMTKGLNNNNQTKNIEYTTTKVNGGSRRKR